MGEVTKHEQMLIEATTGRQMEQERKDEVCMKMGKKAILVT
jgi:hypothetical protein